MTRPGSKGRGHYWKYTVKGPDGNPLDQIKGPSQNPLESERVLKGPNKRSGSEPELKPVGTRTNIPTLEDFQNHWNFHGTLPAIRTFAPKRQKALIALCKDPDFVENWRSAVARLAGSLFHTGQIPGKTWRADVDWFLKPDNFVKALELSDPRAPTDLSPHGDTRDPSPEEAARMLEGAS